MFLGLKKKKKGTRERKREKEKKRKKKKTREKERKKRSNKKKLFYLLLDVLDDGVDVDLVVAGLDGDGGALRGRAGGLFIVGGGGETRKERLSVFFSLCFFSRRSPQGKRPTSLSLRRRSIASLFFFLKRSAPCSSEQSSSRQSTAPKRGIGRHLIFPERQRPQKHCRRRPTARHSAARRQSRPSVDCLERGFFFRCTFERPPVDHFLAQCSLDSHPITEVTSFRTCSHSRGG